MIRMVFRFIIGLLSTSLICINSVSAQMPLESVRGLGVDAQFEVAREQAFAGNYEQARRIGYHILEQASDYHDVRILVARTYAWEGQRDKARDELEYVLDRAPDYRDALLARIDLERWDDRPQTALEFANRALDYYPQDTSFLVKKAQLLADLEQYDDAERVVAEARELAPEDETVATAGAAIDLRRPRPNQIAAGISVKDYSDIFSHDPIAFVQYGRNTEWGSVIGRVNYRDRFGSSGSQVEMDFYPSLGDGLYAYLNYGYSSSDVLFPQHRFGAEIYKNLPHGIEASIGYRHLAFTSTNVNIYTGSIGKYFGNYFIGFRPYITPGDSGTSLSGNFNLRRYFGNAEEYIELRGGYGESVQERQFQNVAAQGVTVESWSIGLAGQWEFIPYTYAYGSFDVGEEELVFAPGEFVDTYNLSFSIRHRF